MKVFLGNPPWREGDRYGVRAGSRWPFTSRVEQGGYLSYIPFPFFLGYATALLEKNDVVVKLIDAIAEGIDNNRYLDRIREYGPDLIVHETSTPSFDVDIAIAREARDVSGAQLALCGPHVTIYPKEVLGEHSFVDYILLGEYEATLLDLMKSLENNSELTDVKGLAFRSNKGIIVNPRRTLVNLDDLPWPAYHQLPMLNYNDSFAGIPTPMVNINASRGCPYRCNYCMWPHVMYAGHNYRVRNPKDVVDEMEWLVSEYGFKSVYFDDDTFNIGKRRILGLCQEIKSRGINIPWAIMARADISDEETLRGMRDVGLYAVKYGVESGSQELVNKAEKNMDLNKVKETVRITKELGIKVHLTFTFGLLGEAKETIRQTINFAKELSPDSIQFSITTPFPGTTYYETAKKRGLISAKRWADFDGASKAAIRTEDLTEKDIENALWKAKVEWNKHSLKKSLSDNKWRYFKMGLTHPIKGMKKVVKLLK
jgi:radical SAM superfamily enzyme YgiQ (UPF0313 family)